MDEFIELSRRQLRMQKLIALLLAALLVLLLAGGLFAAKELRRMSENVNAAMEQLQKIDVERINETVSGTQDMMQSVEDFSAAVDSVTERVKDLDDWIAGIFRK